MSVLKTLKKMKSIDIFKEAPNKSRFIGRPFYLDFEKARLLTHDAWKANVNGIPAGSFILAVQDYEVIEQEEGEASELSPEVVLLRVLGPTQLPTDSDVVSAIVDHYKESNSRQDSKNLDPYTLAEFQFSGLECRILGSFYKENDQTFFGADVDNFYGPSSYSIYKPTPDLLQHIINFHSQNTQRNTIGHIRYSSSRRHKQESNSLVYVSPKDYVGQRTALFGMTRTGKSNTLKKIIQNTLSIKPDPNSKDPRMRKTRPGQIIFDINGEYANDNLQDEGTAIYKEHEQTKRYSILEKGNDFQVMKSNFYTDIESGYSLIQNQLFDEKGDYIRAFLNIDFSKPSPKEFGPTTRWKRKIACYQAVLKEAGLPAPKGMKVYFKGHDEIDKEIGITPDPKTGISIDEAVKWFSWVWHNYQENSHLKAYEKTKGREWADNDLKALMQMLTCYKQPGKKTPVSGNQKLAGMKPFHTSDTRTSFESDITNELRKGNIIIVDLSQGDPIVQQTYSQRLCSYIFKDSMKNFVNNEPCNYIQMYFEEAHNLFPKQRDSDLRNIYNRIAKEGAKLGIGLVYATQEVSSLSSNVLKNTQNWFVSHLNNRDELKEISKFYDFEDFTESLRRSTDKGFIRMKTLSNPFVVPVQIDQFKVSPQQ